MRKKRFVWGPGCLMTQCKEMRCQCWHWVVVVFSVGLCTHIWLITPREGQTVVPLCWWVHRAGNWLSLLCCPQNRAFHKGGECVRMHRAAFPMAREAFCCGDCWEMELQCRMRPTGHGVNQNERWEGCCPKLTSRAREGEFGGG